MEKVKMLASKCETTTRLANKGNASTTTKTGAFPDKCQGWKQHSTYSIKCGISLEANLVA